MPGYGGQFWRGEKHEVFYEADREEYCTAWKKEYPAFSDRRADRSDSGCLLREYGQHGKTACKSPGDDYGHGKDQHIKRLPEGGDDHQGRPGDGCARIRVCEGSGLYRAVKVRVWCVYRGGVQGKSEPLRYGYECTGGCFRHEAGGDYVSSGGG